jgi:hypothetical protein
MILLERQVSDEEIARHAEWLSGYEQFDGEDSYKVGLHWPEVEYETFHESSLILSSEEDGGCVFLSEILQGLFLNMHRQALSRNPEEFKVAWRVRPKLIVDRFGCENCQDGPHKYAFWSRTRCRLAFVKKEEYL